LLDHYKSSNEVEWDDRGLSDGVEDVYSFSDDQHDSAAGVSSSVPRGVYDEREELPNGIVTTLTKCFTSTCAENDQPCYAWSCPRRVKPNTGLGRGTSEAFAERTEANEVGFLDSTLFCARKMILFMRQHGWSDSMDPAILGTLPTSEISRQKYDPFPCEIHFSTGKFNLNLFS
jgi:hypothetical protein